METKELSEEYFKKTNKSIPTIFNNITNDNERFFGFNFWLWIGCSISNAHVDFLKEFNNVLLNNSWKALPIDIRRWVEINELIILHFDENNFQYNFIKKNSLNTATILAYHLLEDITKGCNYWDENGKILKNIPLLSDDWKTIRTYNRTNQISSLEHKLIIYIKDSPKIIQEFFEALDNLMNYQLENLRLQWVDYEKESIYKKFTRNRNIVSHWRDSQLWESILLSHIFWMIHFYYNSQEW